MTQEEINKNLQKRIEDLEKQLKDSRSVSREFESIMLDVIFKGKDADTAKTQTIEESLSGNPQTISFDVPAAYTGYILAKYKGGTIRIPYI